LYLVIVGAGTVGAPLCSSLVATGHEVFALDLDATRVSALEKALGSVAGIGDGTTMRSLADAGTARAGVFIAVTGRDEDNLAACQLAKARFNVSRTIALVNSPDNAPLFELLGVDVVVSATDLVLSHIAGALPAHPLVRLMPVTGRSKEIVGIKVPAGATVVGKPLNQIPVPYGGVISLVIGRNGSTEVPTPETVIESEDEIIAVTPLESTETLWETLTELA